MSEHMQMLFDKVVEHASQMKKKALEYDPVVDGNRCKYRTCDGNKCFVGALIKDEHYSEDIENTKISSTPVMKALVDSFEGIILDGSDIHMLEWCQTIHDSLPTDEWDEAFEDCAHSFDLEYRSRQYGVNSDDNQ